MSTSPPPGPGKPPAATDFDEDAPTSVVPGRPHQADLDQSFDEGGELDDDLGPLDVDEDSPTESAHTRKIAVVGAGRHPRVTAPMPIAEGEPGEDSDGLPELAEDDLDETNDA
jgi:hypothetical protein